MYSVVAVLYTEPKPHYYWGKLTKVFSDNGDTDMTLIEVHIYKKDRFK